MTSLRRVAAIVAGIFISSNCIASECPQLDLVRGHLKFINPEHSKDMEILINTETNIQAYSGLTKDNTVLLNWVDSRTNDLITSGEISASGILSMETKDKSSAECLSRAHLHFFRADENVWALVNDNKIISLWQGPFPANFLFSMEIMKKQ